MKSLCDIFIVKKVRFLSDSNPVWQAEMALRLENVRE
jgi:hypothetical protein